MTNELLKSFGTYFENEKVVIDSYKLQKGIYYLFSKEGNLMERLEVDKDTDYTTNVYEYFKIRDFYSNYIDSNKAVENKLKEKVDYKEYSMNKKICSNNYLTLFFKNKFVKGLNGNNIENDSIPKEIFIKGIKEYFKSLVNLGEGRKKGEEEILKSISNIVSTKEDILSNCENIQNAFLKVTEDIEGMKDIKKDIWIKIFTEESEAEYQRASNKYIALKLFNKNDNNIVEKNQIYGINNYNFGLNSKKPFLELKSTPYKVGLITNSDINKIRNLFIWLLKNVANKNYVQIPLNYDFKTNLDDIKEINGKTVYLFRVINDNGSCRIEDFEIVPNYNTRIKRFNCNNYINPKLNLENMYINTECINDLEAFVSQIWFSKYLTSSYYTFKESVSKSKIPEWKKKVLERYYKVFRDLFLKEDSTLFKQKLYDIGSEITLQILKDEFEERKIFNAARSMNLWIALDKYFNKEMNLEMKINDISERAKEVVLKIAKITSDDLYYFLVGQVTYYMVSNSEAKKIRQDIIEPIIKSNSEKKLKMELQFLHDKYKHAIYLNDKKFNNIFSQILLNNPEGSVRDNKDMILAGILSENIFYDKKEEGNK